MNCSVETIKIFSNHNNIVHGTQSAHYSIQIIDDSLIMCAMHFAKLGEIGEEGINYEVVITSKYLEQYKYCLMFIGNGISGYPAEIVLDRDVASEINKDECEIMSFV